MRGAVILLSLITAPAAAQTQAEMNAQASRDYARADAAMTVAYRTAMARMARADATINAGPKPEPSYRNALLFSQRAWLAFRDAECRAEGYNYYGGSMRPMVELGCKAKLSAQRTRQLQAIQKQP